MLKPWLVGNDISPISYYSIIPSFICDRDQTRIRQQSEVHGYWFQSLGIPEIEYDACATIPSSWSAHIRRDLSQLRLDESVHIEASKDSVCHFLCSLITSSNFGIIAMHHNSPLCMVPRQHYVRSTLAIFSWLFVLGDTLSFTYHTPDLPFSLRPLILEIPSLPTPQLDPILLTPSAFPQALRTFSYLGSSCFSWWYLRDLGLFSSSNINDLYLSAVPLIYFKLLS
jgi:hypothetical protein